MFNGGEFSKILDEIFEKDEKEKEKAIKIYCKIWEYLENITLQNLKYKRAFEILKQVKYTKQSASKCLGLTQINIETEQFVITNEEYEMLEELMKSE